MSTAEPREGCAARRHGDAAAYARYRCRCADAREDWRLCRKRGREGRHVPRWVDGVGSARRLRALAVLGYGLHDLAGPLEWSKSQVQNVQSQKARRVRRVTAYKVTRVYDELSMIPGPSSRARLAALRRGWAAPLAWDDDEIDNPDAQPATGTRRWTYAADETRVAAVLAGDLAAREALKGPDRQELVRRLHGLGLMDPEICARTGISRRLVQYLRSRLCLPSNTPAAVKARSVARPLRNEQEVA